jgi:peptide/nickel transport system permease protein
VRGSLTDRMVMIVCTVGLSISILVYIIVFQYVFAYKLGWFPVQGWGDSFWENLFVYSSLPILIGLAVSIAPDLRLYRTFVLDEINQDYVRTARAKGAPESIVMRRHVLRNAMLPVVTMLGMDNAIALGGAVLIEEVFGLPGLGDLAIQSVYQFDLPKIVGVTVFASVLVIGFNLLVDLLYAWIDPRIRLA